MDRPEESQGRPGQSGREWQAEEPLHAGEVIAEGVVQPIEEEEVVRQEREEGVGERHFEEGGVEIGGYAGKDAMSEGAAGGGRADQPLEQRLAAVHQDMHRAQREADTMREELVRARDQAARALADLENWRKRYSRDLDRELLDQRKSLLLGFLPIADNLERALASRTQAQGQAQDRETGGEGAEALLKGVEMVLTMFREALRRSGVARIDAQDAPFDPNYHEAIGTRGDDPAKAGHVVQVVEPGYRLNNEVLRPARVMVGGRSTEMATSTAETPYEGP